MATLTATGLRDNAGKEGLQSNTKSPDLKGGSKVKEVQRLPLRTSERGREEEVTTFWGTTLLGCSRA